MAPRTLVLIPGAWHGGWCWSRVVAKARERGAEARALTLTGLGDRAHLLGPEVGLETHVRDVAATIEAEELVDVVLVGHSYAGMLLADVAERTGGVVRALVFLDALVPVGGESALDLFPAEVAAALTEGAQRSGGIAVPPWPAGSFGITDEADRRWVDRHLTPHPYRTLTEPPAERTAARLPRLFVACTQRQRPTYLRFAEQARAGAGWDYAEVACGHDAMVIAPGPLTDLLVAFAARV